MHRRWCTQKSGCLNAQKIGTKKFQRVFQKNMKRKIEKKKEFVSLIRNISWLIFTIFSLGEYNTLNSLRLENESKSIATSSK